jgi:RNA polymerase sporulation-specific sigma factor
VSARHRPVANEAALVASHRGLAEAIASDYFIPGADREDVIQEALIGLLVAARMFDGRGEFKAFAGMVVRRWVQTEVTRARREKRRPITEAVRTLRDPETGDDWAASELIEDHYSNVLDLLTGREDYARFAAAVRSLTDLERRAIAALVNEEHPHSGGTDKSLDNALQRARAKLRKAA